MSMSETGRGRRKKRERISSGLHTQCRAPWGSWSHPDGVRSSSLTSSNFNDNFSKSVNPLLDLQTSMWCEFVYIHVHGLYVTLCWHSQHPEKGSFAQSRNLISWTNEAHDVPVKLGSCIELNIYNHLDPKLAIQSRHLQAINLPPAVRRGTLGDYPNQFPNF